MSIYLNECVHPPAGRIHRLAKTPHPPKMEVVICNDAAAMRDFAIEPEFHGGSAAIEKAVTLLAEIQVAVLFHRPSCSWILHAHQPPKVLSNFQRQLRTIADKSGIYFGDVTQLDRFHGEVLGLFKVPRCPAAAAEPSQVPEDAMMVFSTGLADGLAPLGDAMRERDVQQILRGYEGWTSEETQHLWMMSEKMREESALQLTEPVPLKDWMVIGGPVRSLMIYQKPKMSLERKLKWTFFRMKCAGMSTEEPKIAAYKDFLTCVVAISADSRGAVTCSKAREMWALWSDTEPHDMPADAVAFEKLVRTGHAVQCIVCAMPVPPGSQCCKDCIPFACLEHGCAKELLPQEHCPDGVPGDVHRMRAVLANIQKLQRFSEANALCKDWPAERNRVAQEARAEMMRDGCCQGGLCGLHVGAHEKLGAADQQHRLFRAGGVRWSTVDEELDRLMKMLRPIRRFAQYSCPRCNVVAAPTQQSAEGKAFVEAVRAWDNGPAPLDGSRKRPFTEFLAFREQDAADRLAKWARLSHGEKAQRWNPLPGAFMLVPPADL